MSSKFDPVWEVNKRLLTYWWPRKAHSWLKIIYWWRRVVHCCAIGVSTSLAQTKQRNKWICMRAGNIHKVSAHISQRKNRRLAELAKVVFPHWPIRLSSYSSSLGRGGSTLAQTHFYVPRHINNVWRHIVWADRGISRGLDWEGLRRPAGSLPRSRNYVMIQVIDDPAAAPPTCSFIPILEMALAAIKMPYDNRIM